MSSPSLCPMILWDLDEQVLLRANRLFVEATGLTPEECSQRALLSWIHPDDRSGLEQMLASGQGTVRARHATAKGEWIDFEWELSPHAGDRVALGRGLDPSMTAVSSLSARAQGPRTTLAATLEAMVHIVEAKNPGKLCSILLVDEDKEYVTVGAGPSFPAEYNAAVEGLRIGPAVGSCGTAAYWNIPVVVENIHTDPLWKDLRGAAAIAGVSACWSQPITTNSNEVLGAMALYDTEPSQPTRNQMDGLEIAARMVGLAIEHHRLEEQLRQAAKMEALGVIASGIAHDFNNMLSIVLGNAERAMAALAEGDKTRPMLQEIITASMGATDFCNQMLAFAGRGALSTEVVEINGLVTEIGTLLQVALSKKAELVFQLEDAPLGVQADRSQMRQVVMNLITNASEALGDSPGCIVVSTTTRTFRQSELDATRWQTALEPGTYVRLRVQDTGCGVTPKTQAKIFDPFFTTKATGRGLGLAAVQGIVRGHRGAISMESRPGAGTSFTIMLPLVSLPEQDRPVLDDAAGTSPGGRILVVDDEPSVLRILTDILEDSGYDVVTARDGQEAVDIYRAQSAHIDTGPGTGTDAGIDLVLLDLSMPRLNGIEVFHELFKIRKDVRVILSSGFTEQEILERSAGIPLAGVVQKPTQMHVLLAKVSEALASGQNRIAELGASAPTDTSEATA